MTLPNFDNFGNLPAPADKVGAPTSAAIPVGLPEIEARFVSAFPQSKTRKAVWGGFTRHFREVCALGIPFVVFVDGSFVSNKGDPNDIDVCYIFDGGKLNAADSVQKAEIRRLFDNASCKGQYLTDVYMLPYYEISSPRVTDSIGRLLYWATVFSKDRRGNHKAFLIVRGVMTP